MTDSSLDGLRKKIAAIISEMDARVSTPEAPPRVLTDAEKRWRQYWIDRWVDFIALHTKDIALDTLERLPADSRRCQCQTCRNVSDKIQRFRDERTEQ